MRSPKVLIILFIYSYTAFSQSNTEVHLFDVSQKGEHYVLSNHKNISNNDGYDNQPSFYDDNSVLFSSTTNNQTDIASYDISTNKIKWINSTPDGSEYSPTKIPNQEDVSAIRLDNDGKQLLYQYDYKTGTSKVLIEDLKVGYHTWFNQETLLSSVLVASGMSLVVSNLNDNSNTTYQNKVGRSLHKIPNSNLISYISKEGKIWEIKSINPITGATKKIINTIPGVEDMCWLNDNIILMGKGNTIFKFNTKTDKSWNVFHTFTNKELGNITRLTVNASATKLAVVSDVSPEHIVQKQLDAYNARDIEGFLATYTKDIKAYKFPNTIEFEGLEEMRKIYADFFNSTPDLHCKIKNRIVIGNKVIDEEFITANGQSFGAVVIYEVKNGKISKVTFVQ